MKEKSGGGGGGGSGVGVSGKYYFSLPRYHLPVYLDMSVSGGLVVRSTCRS